jgi:hypothetical protein
MKKVKWLKLNIRLEFETFVRRLSLIPLPRIKGKVLFLIKYGIHLAYGRLSSASFIMILF